jgi:hypothetical protein
MDYTHILSMLRGKQRIGQTNPNPDKAPDKQTQDDLQKLIKTIPNASAAAAAYADAINLLNTQNNSLSQGLGKTIGIYQDMNVKILALTKNITFLERHNSQLNKIFKVGSGKAQEYAETIRDIGSAIGFSDTTITKYVGGLNELTNGFLLSSKIASGAKKNYRDQMIAFQTYAVETMGLTEDQATGFQKYAGTMGVGAAEASDAIRAVSEAAADEMGIDALTAQHDILAGIGEMTDDVRMNYSKIPGSLEVAVLKAKALGVTMAQLDSMGESLMNIEQSVGQEMEYQLLTGKRLLVQGEKSFTNEFRMAKLTGDGPKQAQLLADVLEEQGDTLRTNYMARKKFAEMAGISDSELSAVLTKTQIAKDLGVEGLGKLEGDDLTKKVAELKKEYTAMGEKGAKKLEDLDKLTASQDTRTTHEVVVEDNLKAIADAIGRQAGGVAGGVRKIDVGKIREELPGAMTTAFNGWREQFDAIAPALGKLTIATETIETLNEPVKKLTAAFSGFTLGIDTLFKRFSDFTKITLKTGDPTPPAVVGGTDVLITPNKGPMIRPAKNDVIAAFRPNDVIQNTLSGMAKPAGGDGGMASMLAAFEKIIKTPAPAPAQSFDIKSFASAIATALQSVKIEAKIRTDDVYASTSMNNGKNIT